MTERVNTKPLGFRYQIQVLAKALTLLNALAAYPNGLSLAEVTCVSNLPKSSAYRYLITFKEDSYIEQIPGTEKYRLGIKLFELGSVVEAQFDVQQVALPVMHHLLESFNETVNLAILESGQMVYLAVLESTQSIRMAARPGRRHYAHSTALGKAILAHLPESKVESILAQQGMVAMTPRTITTTEQLKEDLARVRANGYAVDDIENETGVRCVGAPIFNHQREVIAALSISGPVDRIPIARIECVGRELANSTKVISERLGYRDQRG